MDPVAKVISVFQEKYKSIPFVCIAPGRINLIGEHTDYNEGFVMPAAIDRHLVFALRPNGTDHCNIYAADPGEETTFSIHKVSPGKTWVNYLMGMVDAFQSMGLAPGGVDCVTGGNIPVGAGLSSSAALCCGFGFALNEIFGWHLDRTVIAKAAQRAEHNFAGVKVGIMDQYACLIGQRDHALLLDCRSLTHKPLPFHFPDYNILLIDTGVKHALASSAYNDRRASCEEGVHVIQKNDPEVLSLRDVSKIMLFNYQDKLGEDTFIKCLYVVDEISRTQKAAGLLQASDLDGFGALMYDTHWGLSKAYDVSCEELDLLVSLAEEDRKVVPGARMMGGGFGGCTINLVRKDKEESFREKVRTGYFATFKTEPDFYAVKLSDGVHAIAPPATNS